MAIVKITRNLLKQFYGIGATPTYSACGPFTKLTEENSPEIDDTAFIGDKNSSPTVTGYKNKWSLRRRYTKGMLLWTICCPSRAGRRLVPTANARLLTWT